MPIPAQRDAVESARQLATWLGPKVGAEGEVTLSEFRGPGATGFSNETILVDATWTSGGTERTETYVVRVAPTGYTLFPDAAFETQYKVLTGLAAHSKVPVPRVLWFEEDASVLGAPFFVMEEVKGVVPPDNPPYHVDGWLKTDSTPEVRERIWWGCIDTIAELHQTDPSVLGLENMLEGLPAQLAYYESFLESVEKDEPAPTARKALAWLKENQPGPEDNVLCWGDARIGNVMYDEQGNRVAVLDWEMVSLGARAQDFAWALFLDRHHSEMMEVPRLEGFPTKEESIARYEAKTGQALQNLDYYEVFAGFRFSVIMARLAVIFKDWGLLPADHDMGQNNHASRLTEIVLAERGA
jgi:aminoglycoside phosphotransferase (APT) family kinase protein